MTRQITAAQVAGMFSEGIEADLRPTRAALGQARARHFAQTLRQRLTRNILGLAYACHPKRIAAIPPLLGLVLREWCVGQAGLPDPETALAKPDGLCGLVHDLSPATMLEAYARGLFAWKHCGPLKYWAPAQRYSIDPAALKVNKNVQRLLRRGDFSVTFDRCFDAVMLGCALPRPGYAPLTWLTPPMMQAFADLHVAGHAHSFEVWDAQGRLVGGGFGVSVGRVFVTESQFSCVSNASKVGFAELNRHLAAWGFLLNDCKYFTPTLQEMGFSDIPRSAYNRLLADNLGFAKGRNWQFVAAPVASVSHARPLLKRAA